MMGYLRRWAIPAAAMIITAALLITINYLTSRQPSSNVVALNDAASGVTPNTAPPQPAPEIAAPQPAPQAEIAPTDVAYGAAPAPAAATAMPQAPPASGLPPAIITAALVRNTMLAVDQANKTGNYTVLRDLGAPDFRNTNDAARLAQIFATLKAQGVDLLAVAVIDPVYKEPPRLTDKQMLYVAGTYAIAPRAVAFELLFQNVAGRWLIYGVSIVPV